MSHIVAAWSELARGIFADSIGKLLEFFPTLVGNGQLAFQFLQARCSLGDLFLRLTIVFRLGHFGMQRGDFGFQSLDYGRQRFPFSAFLKRGAAFSIARFRRIGGR